MMEKNNFILRLKARQSLGVLLVAASVDRGWIAPVFSVAALGVLVLGALVSRKVNGRVAASAGA